MKFASDRTSHLIGVATLSLKLALDEVQLMIDEFKNTTITENTPEDVYSKAVIETKKKIEAAFSFLNVAAKTIVL